MVNNIYRNLVSSFQRTKNGAAGISNMPNNDFQDVGYLDEDDVSQGFIDRGAQPTQSIDLKGLVAELDTLGENLRTDDLEETPFGKLMEAVPIPVLLLDEKCIITFLNQAVGKINSKYELLKGKECASLFPDPRVAKHINSLIKTVYFDRQIQVLESVLQIADSKIWGRVHLQPLRWGQDTSVLVLIEDLTLEKTQLALQKKMRKELEKRVDERTRDLAKTNERLQQEIGERKRAESELIKHHHNLEQLVVERTRELNATIARIKQEIKERKKAENSLRSSENRLQLAFHANPGAVSIVSLNDGKYLDVNASFCKFSGYTPEEVIGRTDDELKYWAHSGLRDLMIQALKDVGSVSDFEAVFRSKNGKVRVGSLSAEVIEVDGQPYTLSVVIDVTEQKRAERDQNLFLAAIDTVDESVLICDSRGFIKFANSAFEAASGYSRAELRGQDISMIISPENNQNVLRFMQHSTKNGSPWQGQLMNRNKDGSLYEVEATILPVSGKSSRSLNFVTVERNANQYRQERTLPHAKDIGTTAANLALEFNDILAASMGYAYLAREKLDPDNPGRQDLDCLIGIGDRAADLTKRMLTFSGMSSAEYSSEPLMRGTERILLVDDEDQVVTVGQRILESAGYEVTGLTDVSEAIAAFQANPAGFDLVISDLSMPSMSGLEFAEALEGVHPDVRVLICTSYCEPSTLFRIVNPCIRDVVLKPVQPNILCKAVRRALDQDRPA